MPQLVPSEKLKSMLGNKRPVNVTVNDGETLEQAESRVMKSDPFQAALAGKDLPSVQAQTVHQNPGLIDPDLNKLLAVTGGNTKAAEGYLGNRKAQEEIRKSSTDESGLVNAGKNISDLMKHLRNIPAGEGPIDSTLMGGTQWLSSWIPGLDSEAKEFRKGSHALVPLLAGKILGEKKLSPTLMENAIENAMPSLMSSKGERETEISRLQTVLQNETGRDWTQYFQDPTKAGKSVTPSGAPPAINPHPQDGEALKWAQQNLKDPMALKILMANGVMK